MKWQHVLARARRSLMAVMLVAGFLSQLLAANENVSLLGRAAPAWQDPMWLDSVPRDLSNFRGKVVLIRWWTAPGCPYCRATAPALNEFFQTYRPQGLEVIGLYHHKSAEPLELDAVREHARQLGFKFPIAVDPGWRTLKEWWLNGGDTRWTSVSFLIDRRGIVRHIHPGGQYVKGDPEYSALKTRIEELLREP
jgi:peroxiredoxin